MSAVIVTPMVIEIRFNIVGSIHVAERQYATMKTNLLIPDGYKPLLDLLETEKAIRQIKNFFLICVFIILFPLSNLYIRQVG